MSTPTPPGRDRAADLERLADHAIERIRKISLVEISEAIGFGTIHIHDSRWDEKLGYLAALRADLHACLRREWAARKGGADHASD